MTISKFYIMSVHCVIIIGKVKVTNVIGEKSVYLIKLSVS